MRYYTNLEEARSELMRDLKELSTPVRTASYQNRPVEDDSMATCELRDYSYTILDVKSLVPKNADIVWASFEWDERINNYMLRDPNPGRAWIHRRDYWEQFLDNHGMFDYTYGERINDQVETVIALLRRDPYTRRAIISIWDREADDVNNLECRVPCSMYYQLMIRDATMSIAYHQRSCDLFEHWQNDLHFAAQMVNHVAWQLRFDGMKRVIHHVGSLHAYNKDLEGVF